MSIFNGDYRKGVLALAASNRWTGFGGKNCWATRDVRDNPLILIGIKEGRGINESPIAVVRGRPDYCNIAGDTANPCD
ncbi:hypothetical protein [Candidatus Kuenenia stuttgartiensis]|uniref:hypothetical protein n=1 Tax=Kuenenia stuttgartiensis TaxID=174633 RepID=UPI00146C88E9|nr:hypothetical protein [Candidatus Kuenenia stuttgartiensis]